MELKSKEKDTYVIFSDEEINIFIKAEGIMYRLLNEMRDKGAKKLTLICGTGKWKINLEELAKICTDFGSVSSGSAEPEEFD